MRTIIAVIIASLQTVCASAQKTEKCCWHLLDPVKDSVMGISAEKAYAELLKHKTPQEVIVAVIDGGVDVEHEDLKSVIWNNPKEIAGNGLDDDGNGFIDDIHGWNFFGSMQIGDEEFDLKTLATRARTDAKLEQEFEQHLKPYASKVQAIADDRRMLESMTKNLKKDDNAIDYFKNFIPENQNEWRIQKEMVTGLKLYPAYVTYRLLQLQRAEDHYRMELAYYQLQDYNIVTGGPTTHHGTHIAGIIAAMRNNNKGARGVFDDSRIMVVRTIRGINPLGAEPDKPAAFTLTDQALEMHKKFAAAIRYAADNGAKVINMSFGLPWTLNSDIMQQAVLYAREKDVLIIHAAGNDGTDLDAQKTFPDRNTATGKLIAENWIEVGASGPKDDGTLAAHFSNYGKTKVDVFAPGVDIFSTAPRSSYLNDTGTSMAAPMASGLAALLRGYFPQLTAKQTKLIIMRSVTVVNSLENKAISSGVINVYAAIKLAQSSK